MPQHSCQKNNQQQKEPQGDLFSKLSLLNKDVQEFIKVHSPKGFGVLASRNNRNEITIEKIEGGSLAEKAGLKVGDSIIGKDGRWMKPEALIQGINNDSNGSFSLRVRRRNGEVHEIAIKNFVPLAPFGAKVMYASIGSFSLDNGMRISAGSAPVASTIYKGSYAESLGLKENDIICAFYKSGMSKPYVFGGSTPGNAIEGFIAGIKPGEKVTLTVLRRKGRYDLESHTLTSGRGAQKRTSVPVNEDFRM